jgi:hypothetical protein
MQMRPANKAGPVFRVVPPSGRHDPEVGIDAPAVKIDAALLFTRRLTQQ